MVCKRPNIIRKLGFRDDVNMDEIFHNIRVCKQFWSNLRVCEWKLQTLEANVELGAIYNKNLVSHLCDDVFDHLYKAHANVITISLRF